MVLFFYKKTFSINFFYKNKLFKMVLFILTFKKSIN